VAKTAQKPKDRVHKKKFDLPIQSSVFASSILLMVLYDVIINVTISIGM
jgi:hypothetical protein